MVCEIDGPVVAVSDNVAILPDQIARWLPHGLVPLGTDGFGRSDTRAALRRHFEVDAEHVVVAALGRLAAEGHVTTEALVGAMERFGINPEAPAPLHA